MEVDTPLSFLRRAGVPLPDSSADCFIDAQGDASDVTAALERGDPVVALIASNPYAARFKLLARLCVHPVLQGTRIVRVGGLQDGQVGVRRFCHLLLAASAPGTAVDNPVEHLTHLLTTPCGGERRLTLIVENADALMADTLAFITRLAVASVGRPLRIQVLLLGSQVLRLRLARTRPASVTWLTPPPPPEARAPSNPRSLWRSPHAMAVAGGAAAVLGLALIIVDDREPFPTDVAAYARQASPPVLSRAAFTVGDGDGAALPSEPAAAFPTPALEPSSPPGPAQVQTAWAAPAEDATPPAAGTVPQTGEAASGEAPEPQAAPTDAAGRPWPEPASAASPLPLPLVAPIAEAEAEPLARDLLYSEPQQAERPVSPAMLTEPPAAILPAAETVSQGTVIPASAPPVPEPPGTAPPQAGFPDADARTDAAATADGSRTGIEARPMTVSSAVPPPLATPHAGPAPQAAAAAGAMAPAGALPQPLSRPPAAAVAALLARGDALIALGDVAAARLVYHRAAALDSARAATAMGRTYDPRQLRAIGAIGVVADPEAAAAWYRRGAALGDQDAMPLLDDLTARASR